MDVMIRRGSGAVWRALALGFALVVAACGGGGDSTPAPAGPTATPASTGRLTVTIAGLPAGVAGNVRVAGPNAYARTLTATSTLTDVPAGAVTVTPSNVASGGTTYSATVAGSPATVVAGATATATVSYAAVAGAGFVVVSGTVRYESVPATGAAGLNYAGTVLKPVRGATVKILNAGANDAVVATTATDASGRYSASVPTSVAQVKVLVVAEYVKAGAPGWTFKVVDNTDQQSTWAVVTSARSPNGAPLTVDLTARSGWDGQRYAADRLAAPFAILDVVYRAHQKLLAIDPNRSYPELRLNWSADNRPSSQIDAANGLIGTSSFRRAEQAPYDLFILGAENVDTDEYDSHIVGHELGHYLQHVASRNESPGGPHSGQRLDMLLAFSEGWGNAWGAIVLDDPKYVDTGEAGQRTCNVCFDLSVAPTVQTGWFSEDSVGHLVWTLTSRLGLASHWQAMTSPFFTQSLALPGLHLFAASLKRQVPAQASTVDALLAAQGVTAADGFGTTETNSGGIADALPLYRTYTGVGTSQQLCVTDAAGAIPGGLGRFQYVRMTLPASRRYTITVRGGADPDFLVFAAGRRVASAQTVGPAVETLAVDLAAGEYVMWVRDFQLSGRQCLTLTVN